MPVLHSHLWSTSAYAVNGTIPNFQSSEGSVWGALVVESQSQPSMILIGMLAWSANHLVSGYSITLLPELLSPQEFITRYTCGSLYKKRSGGTVAPSFLLPFLSLFFLTSFSSIRDRVVCPFLPPKNLSKTSKLTPSPLSTSIDIVLLLL